MLQIRDERVADEGHSSACNRSPKTPNLNALLVGLSYRDTRCIQPSLPLGAAKNTGAVPDLFLTRGGCVCVGARGPALLRPRRKPRLRFTLPSNTPTRNG